MPNKYLDSEGLAEYTGLVKSALNLKADLASPALTGTPTAPTPATGDNSTKLATTAFVNTKASDYLPLAGGTITGVLKTSSYISYSTDSGRLSLNGGNTGGAYLNMYGQDHGTWPGLFSLAASDGQTTYQLQGALDGTLKWRGNDIAIAKDVLALSGGTMTGNVVANKQFFEMTNSTLNGRNSIYGGTSGSTGAFLYVYGKNHTSLAGNFILHANDGTNTSELVGKPDGTLTWGGKNVERVNASGTNYIRYENGFQVCWGNCATSASGVSANTFPVAFSAAPKVVAQEKPGTINHTIYMVKLSNVTTTGFQSVITDGTNYQQWVAEYIAVGRWK